MTQRIRKPEDFPSGDPVGEALIESLEAQIREAGVAGYVFIATRSRAHFRHPLDAPWTALAFNPKTGEMRLRIKKRDFKTPEQAQQVLTDTVHVLHQFVDAYGRSATAVREVLQRLIDGGLEIEHHPGHDFIPARTSDE